MNCGHDYDENYVTQGPVRHSSYQRILKEINGFYDMYGKAFPVNVAHQTEMVKYGITGNESKKSNFRFENNDIYNFRKLLHS